MGQINLPQYRMHRTAMDIEQDRIVGRMYGQYNLHAGNNGWFYPRKTIGMGATYHYDAAKGEYVDEAGNPDPVTVASAAGFDREFHEGTASTTTAQAPGTVVQGAGGYSVTADAQGNQLLWQGIYDQQAEKCWLYTDNLAEQYACTLRNAALQDRIFATPINGVSSGAAAGSPSTPISQTQYTAWTQRNAAVTQDQASAATNRPNQSVPPQSPLTPGNTNISSTGQQLAHQMGDAQAPADNTGLLIAAALAALVLFTRRG